MRALMKLHGEAIGTLKGVVELDEKYLGGKPRFVQGTINPRGKVTRKSCINVAVERKGDVKADLVPGDSYSYLVCQVAQAVSLEAHVMTDQLPAYKTIGRNMRHMILSTMAPRSSAGTISIVNTAESFNAILERAKQGVIHNLSKRHLRRYIGEIAFRWNNRDPVEKKTKKGVSKIVMQAKPILEQLQNLLRYAVGTQIRRTIYGGIVTPQPSFG
jgi:hypothetical protein